MRREAGSPKILVSLIIPELRVLVLTKRHVGSGNEIVLGKKVLSLRGLHSLHGLHGL